MADDQPDQSAQNVGTTTTTSNAGNVTVASNLNADEAQQLLNDEGNTGDEQKPGTFSQADVDRMIAERLKRERDKFKDYNDLKAKASQHDQAEEAKKTAEQRAQEAAQIAQERANQMLLRLVRSEIRALAADKFADPDDPGGFLDPTRYANPDGEVDVDAIRGDLDDLLARKPHLGKPEPGPRAPAPNRAQGSSGTGAVEPEVEPGLGRLRYAYGATSSK